MKRKEIISEASDPHENRHSPKIDLSMIQSLMDTLANLPAGYEFSLQDSPIAAGSGLLVLGAVGDPDIAGRMRGEIARELSKPGMRTADDEVSISGGAEAGDTGTSNIEGYFDPNNLELAFRSEYIQGILSGNVSDDVANTVIHEMMHRGLYIVEQLPEFRNIIPNDLRTVWSSGWGDINYNRYPMVSDQDGTTWQINPEHAMVYSGLNSMDSFYVDLFVRQFPLVNSIAAEFFNGNDYAQRTILRDVDADPETGFAKMYYYWRNLLNELDRNVAGLLQNLTRVQRPRMRPPGMRGGAARLSDGTNIGDLSTDEKAERIRNLIISAQQYLDSLNESHSIAQKYAALLEMRLELFEALSNEDRNQLQQILDDLRLLLDDPETVDSLDPEQVVEYQSIVTQVETALDTDEQGPEEVEIPQGDGEELDEPVRLEPEDTDADSDSGFNNSPQFPERADSNTVVMEDTVDANGQMVDIVLAYRIRENRLDVFRTSGVFVYSFGDIGIVQNYRGEDRIGGKIIRNGQMEGSSSELTDANDVLRNGILEILREQNRFIDPNTGDLITPTGTAETQPRVGDPATQEQSDLLKELDPKNYPLPGEPLNQADVGNLMRSGQPDVDTDAPARPTTPDSGDSSAPSTPGTDPNVDTQPPGAPQAPTAPTPGPDDGSSGGQDPNPTPGNRLADQLGSIQTSSLMDDYVRGGKVPNQNVRKLQQGLQQLRMNPGEIDGKYGQLTYDAVKRFQQANGLQVDGEAGPDTLAALSAALRGTNESAELTRIRKLSGI